MREGLEKGSPGWRWWKEGSIVRFIHGRGQTSPRCSCGYTYSSGRGWASSWLQSLCVHLCHSSSASGACYKGALPRLAAAAAGASSARQQPRLPPGRWRRRASSRAPPLLPLLGGRRWVGAAQSRDTLAPAAVAE